MREKHPLTPAEGADPDHWHKRAEELEAALDRVRDVIDETPSAELRHLRARVRAAIDGGEQ